MDTVEIMNTYEGIPTWEMRFISTCDTVSSVWVLSAFLRPDNERNFQAYNDRGLITQDLDGQYWLIIRETYNTVEQAREAAGNPGVDYAGNAIIVIDFTDKHTNGTCLCDDNGKHRF